MDSRSYTFDGADPDIHESASVSQESTLVGEVRVGPDVTVWPGAVLRGDVDPVELGAGSAIGDNAVLHASTVGEDGLVGHGAVLNDSHVESGAMVGFNATISEATVGSGSLVAMGTVVPSGYEVPPDSFVRGTPARVTPLSETDIDRESVFEDFASGDYAHLVDGHEELFDR
ncbi:gamma carbonic anhydrase family protein [Salinibaculum rarum]|uniref:gamma carbonic anhydrase family protein n=1 Tax=Salinibaculum rarum TaxID=3058903 RepID=UPI00265EA140|nr:gamma carbonic anhydrase family protein [Salinibaculum sp. KK48]